MAHFELRRSKDNQFTFTLVVGNGKVVLQSETYKRRAGALKGIFAVAREAGSAEVRDLTKKAKLTMKLFIATLLLSVASWADSINPFNVRPVTLGGTWDSPAACASLGTPSCNLYDLLPALGVTPWSMSSVGLWAATGDFKVDFLMEKTAGAATQSIGIWSGTNAQPLFGPSASGGESINITPSMMAFWGIDLNAFGFYLATDVNPLHQWMYTLDSFNLVGSAQALAFETPNRWVIAWEDLLRDTDCKFSDCDYNDAIISVRGVGVPTTVPEPSGFVLMLTAIGALALMYWMGKVKRV